MAGNKNHKLPSSDDRTASNVSGETQKSKTCVLVVDDDVKILRFLRSSLRLAGYDIVTASSGEEALQLVETAKPQCMVLDILMPVMDGFEVLKRLRVRSNLPVIAVSAHASAAENALNLGANGFLAKPFRPDELIKRIQALLNHPGLQPAQD